MALTRCKDFDQRKLILLTQQPRCTQSKEQSATDTAMSSWQIHEALHGAVACSAQCKVSVVYIPISSWQRSSNGASVTQKADAEGVQCDCLFVGTIPHKG